MQDSQFSEQQLTQWADEVSDQLNALTTQYAALSKGDDPVDTFGIELIPAPQRAIIEVATGESAETFWGKYLRHARLDLCQADGNLYKLWHQWKDLPTKDVVKMSGSALVAMGISLNLMGTVGVAASVVFLHVLLNIGINAICDSSGSTEKKSASH